MKHKTKSVSTSHWKRDHPSCIYKDHAILICKEDEKIKIPKDKQINKIKDRHNWYRCINPNCIILKSNRSKKNKGLIRSDK